MLGGGKRGHSTTSFCKSKAHNSRRLMCVDMYVCMTKSESTELSRICALFYIVQHTQKGFKSFSEVKSRWQPLLQTRVT